MREVIDFHKNGNYSVILFSDGTMIRNCSFDKMIPEFPDSMDLKLTNKCSGGCRYCFTYDTLVETPDGDKKISELKIGDSVLSFDETDHIILEKNVTDVMQRHYSGCLICIELETGKYIKCTPNHKLLTKNRGWVKAEDLVESDILYG